MSGHTQISALFSRVPKVIWKAQPFTNERVIQIQQVDLDVEDANGRTPLHLAAANGDIGTVDVLITAGCDVNKADRSGMKAIDYALRSGQEDLAARVRSNSSILSVVPT